MQYQTLKVEEELHSRFKLACVEAQTTMLEATNRMVLAWVEDVEQRKLALLPEEQTREKDATRQRNEKPSPRPERAASGQKESPNGARLLADSTKHDSNER